MESTPLLDCDSARACALSGVWYLLGARWCCCSGCGDSIGWRSLYDNSRVACGCCWTGAFVEGLGLPKKPPSAEKRFFSFFLAGESIVPVVDCLINFLGADFCSDELPLKKDRLTGDGCGVAIRSVLEPAW